MRITHVFIILATFIVSCAKLPVYNAHWGEVSKTTAFTGYDKKSQIRYTVTNDSSHLHLSLSSFNRMLAPTIMKSGLKIQLNTTGKKHSDYCLTFPYSTEKAGRSRSSSKQKADDSPQSVSAFTSALWQYGEEEKEVINLADNTQLFRGQIKKSENNEFLLQVSIPLYQITSLDYEQYLKQPLTIGLEATPESRSGGASGGASGGGQMGGMQGGKGMGGGRGGMSGGRGGGTSGGRSGGSKGGGGMKGSSSNEGNMQAASVDFWFTVNLAQTSSQE
ncbi:hypothetical protein DMA11_15600 [Marinilabiliaceae bacterium JC017]|nr:hypothetical protein DMA11_15600 [Marinilabiliaceae bacterium JC017]